MRNISILLAIIISIPIFSCGDAQMNTEYENWFGYYSRYKGQTNHAYYNGYTDAEVMAKKVVEAINLSKKLYRTSVTALIPPIFLDNYKTYMDQDNGTCLTNWGWREYNSQPIRSIPSPENYTFECYINYFNYCRYDTLDSAKRQVVINYPNTASKQRIWANYKSDGSTKIVNYELEAKDINITINESTGSDNMSIFGLVIKEASYSTDNLTSEDPTVPKKVTLRLDMPKEETQYRFDFYSDNGTLNFYHYQYGYVTVDISEFINSTEPVPETAKITLLYNDNEKCSFASDEFGTSDFNCDKEYDKQEGPMQ